MLVDGFKALPRTRLVAKLLLTVETPEVLWLQASMLKFVSVTLSLSGALSKNRIYAAALDDLKR